MLIRDRVFSKGTDVERYKGESGKTTEEEQRQVNDAGLLMKTRNGGRVSVRMDAAVHRG